MGYRADCTSPLTQVDYMRSVGRSGEEFRSSGSDSTRMTSVAFIGTREPRRIARDLIDLYVSAARQFAEEGCLLHTSGTPGAERLAAENALRVGGLIRVYLPWRNYEQAWVGDMSTRYPGCVETSVYQDAAHADWAAHVLASHPESKFLSPATTKLYARNYGLLIEADEIVALPYARPVGALGGPVDKGSTATSIEFAQRLGRLLYDLSDAEDRIRLRERLAL